MTERDRPDVTAPSARAALIHQPQPAASTHTLPCDPPYVDPASITEHPNRDLFFVTIVTDTDGATDIVAISRLSAIMRRAATQGAKLTDALGVYAGMVALDAWQALGTQATYAVRGVLSATDVHRLGAGR